MYPAKVSVCVSGDVGIWWTATPVRLCRSGGTVGRECEVGVRMRRRRGLGMDFGVGAGFFDGRWGEGSIIEYGWLLGIIW